MSYSGLSVRRSGTLLDGNVLSGILWGVSAFWTSSGNSAQKSKSIPCARSYGSPVDWQAGRALDTLPLQSPPE